MSFVPYYPPVLERQIFSPERGFSPELPDDLLVYISSSHPTLTPKREDRGKRQAQENSATTHYHSSPCFTREVS